MAEKCTIIMYHYIRPSKYTRYPEIKSLSINQFKTQLDYLEENYTFVKINDCIDAVYKGKELPPNSVLLTFDDGYKEHYDVAFPLLEEREIQGCFFPPAKPIQQNKILNVNKIHYILAMSGDSYEDVQMVVQDIFDLLDEFRNDYNLKSNRNYYTSLAEKGRFDPEDVVFIKKMLQKELKESIRTKITDQLFTKYSDVKEKTLSEELYMSMEQLKCMNRNGMYVGSHGYSHIWMDEKGEGELEKEIDLSINLLKSIGVPSGNWVMNYPYGAYSKRLIQLLKKKGFKLGLTTEKGIANLTTESAFALNRFDTNDIPK